MDDLNFHHPHCDMMPVACAGCEIDGLRNELTEREFKHKKVVDSLHAQMRERRRDYVNSLKCMADAMEQMLDEVKSRKFIAEQIALQIEAELVCCDVYERINSGEDEKAIRQAGDYHAICHWGGCSAAIARKAGRQ